MHLPKIMAFGFAGLILGLSWSHSLSSGYFQAWEKLPHPPSPIIEFVAVGEGHVIAKTTDNTLLRCSNWRHECWVQDERTEYNFDATRVIKPCDFSAPEFSPFKSHPKNIKECVQGVTQYPEGIGMGTYVIDGDGNIWEWSYIFAGNDPLYAMFAPYCCPTLGLVIGIVLFGRKLKNADSQSVVSSEKQWRANNACTGRLGVCAFFRLFLSYGSFPFPVLFLPSRR